MRDFDFNNLAKGVEKRLDKIFPEEFQIHDPKAAKLKFVKPPSLASLRNIIMSLEWEVTDKDLNDLMQELSRLQRAYKKDNQLQKLLKLLFYLGQYIRVLQSDTDPNIFKTLFQSFNVLVKIASGKYSNHQKAKIVNNEIKHYLSLRSYLKRKNKNIYRSTANKYFNTLNENLVELKKFIHLEVKKLRKDLQRLVALMDTKL